MFEDYEEDEAPLSTIQAVQNVVPRTLDLSANYFAGTFPSWLLQSLATAPANVSVNLTVGYWNTVMTKHAWVAAMTCMLHALLACFIALHGKRCHVICRPTSPSWGSHLRGFLHIVYACCCSLWRHADLQDKSPALTSCSCTPHDRPAGSGLKRRTDLSCCTGQCAGVPRWRLQAGRACATRPLQWPVVLLCTNGPVGGARCSLGICPHHCFDC